MALVQIMSNGENDQKAPRAKEILNLIYTDIFDLMTTPGRGRYEHLIISLWLCLLDKGQV